MTDVPDGTVQDVLDWVGDDPGRAQAALDAEQAGAQRSTLITRLEALAVTDSPAGASDATAPTDDPPEIILTPGLGTEISPVFLRDADVEPEGDLREDVGDGDGETKPIEVELVEFFQTVRSQVGFAVAFNAGPTYAFTPQLLAALKGEVDKALAGVVL
jgi:hypothetical protein